MLKISNTIYETYVSRFEELSPELQLHFASRVYQWDGDVQTGALLREMVATSRPLQDKLPEQLTGLLDSNWQEHDRGINQAERRKPYFDRYPRLYGLHQALFQVRNWLIYYDIDARDTLSDLFGKTDLQDLQSKLLADAPALVTLSTYAVNVLYLSKRLLQGDESPLFESLPRHDGNDPTLTIYFATHCVLGETLVYSRAVPADKLPACRRLLAEVEPLLDDPSVSLDARLEFVVMSRLCGYDSPVHETILAGATDAFDSSAGYITDPLKPHKNNLAGAEHRNVLYLLATRPLGQDLRPSA